jgi:hypothetical protein
VPGPGSSTSPSHPGYMRLFSGTRGVEVHGAVLTVGT